MEEILERLKYFRIDVVKLQQKEFAERIGLKANSYNSLENGKRTLTDRHIKPICTEFGLREEWLRFGEEPMYNNEDEFIQLCKTLSSEDKEILKPIIKKMLSPK